MKTFEFQLDQFQLDRVLSSIRTKKDIISLWMNTIKIVSTYSAPLSVEVRGTLVLVVDRMSRLFVVSDQKSFSAAFPFFIRSSSDGIEFASTACPVVDSKVTSQVLALIGTDDILNARSVYKFAEPLMDVDGEQDMIWELVRDLMLCDDGYIRVDCDAERADGDVHPLNHADIFYSQRSTFKIGMHASPTFDEFCDLLNIRTACQYLGSV